MYKYIHSMFFLASFVKVL